MSFINTIAPIIQNESFKRGYNYPSAIIAQSCLESNFGKSSLAYKYHNYFGLKCGSSWKGKSVNLRTKEEYTRGKMTTIKDNFRVYDSINDGVKGYFDFINTKRYNNLKNATSPKNYLELIRADGYATAYQYVTACFNLIKKYELTKYDHISLNSNIDIHKIALDVIAGKYGNGNDRKKALGNNYETIQNEVNRILKNNS